MIIPKTEWICLHHLGPQYPVKIQTGAIVGTVKVTFMYMAVCGQHQDEWSVANMQIQTSGVRPGMWLYASH